MAPRSPGLQTLFKQSILLACGRIWHTEGESVGGGAVRSWLRRLV
jgi:hypothetical protein